MDQFAFTQCNAAAFGVRQEIRVGACFVFLCAFFHFLWPVMYLSLTALQRMQRYIRYDMIRQNEMEWFIVCICLHQGILESIDLTWSEAFKRRSGNTCLCQKCICICSSIPCSSGPCLGMLVPKVHLHIFACICFKIFKRSRWNLSTWMMMMMMMMMHPPINTSTC